MDPKLFLKKEKHLESFKNVATEKGGEGKQTARIRNE